MSVKLADLLDLEDWSLAQVGFPWVFNPSLLGAKKYVAVKSWNIKLILTYDYVMISD